jgi:hypothetical protein
VKCDLADRCFAGHEKMATLPSNAARGKCHEMLKSSLQSLHWPHRSPAWVVRRATLLFKGMPQHPGGPATENVATRTKRHDLRRVALLVRRKKKKPTIS